MTPLFSPFWGAIVGSFLNVCLHRWKSGGQIITPASFCPRCKKSIRLIDNIPILSFFILKGKCRFCHKPISFQYPFVEALTSLLFWLSSLVFYEKSVWLVIDSYILVSFLILLLVSDFNWKLLPHVFNNFFIIFGLLIFGCLNSGSSLFFAATNFLLIGSFLFGFIQFFPNGLGGGDIKMIAGLALWMGLAKAGYIFVFACVAAICVFFVLKSAKLVSWKWKIPFGPFLALGALAVWFFPNIVENIELR